MERAETHVAWMRTVVAVLVWAAVPFLWSRFPTVSFMATIGLATGHAILSHLASRRGWGSLVGRAIVTSIADAALVLALVAVSGGWTSPLTPLLYVSMAAIAYRFPLRYSMGFASVYAGGYVAVLAALGDAGAAPVDLALRVSILTATGLLAALSSTSYREAELERARAEDAFEGILSTVPGDVTLVRREGAFAEDETGDPPLPHRGSITRSMPNWMDEADIENARKALARVFDRGATVEFEATAPAGGDGVTTYRCVVGPLDGHDGAQAAVLVATDVTDRKIAERRLRDHARALEESNDALARYASLTAHDLREPLRDIVRYLQRIDRRENGLSADSREEIAFVVRRARRLDSLVRALHRFAEVDQRLFEVEQVDLAAALEDALHVANPSGSTRAEIETGPLGTVTADRRAVVEVLAHLLENAQEHADRDVVHVRVWAEETDDGWRISVEDDGPGIPPRYHERIFEPFRRLDADATSERTGMGLARARRLVERLGGEIGVEARPGEGSLFTFTVPRRPVLVDADRDPALSRPRGARDEDTVT